MYVRDTQIIVCKSVRALQASCIQVPTHGTGTLLFLGYTPTDTAKTHQGADDERLEHPRPRIGLP